MAGGVAGGVAVPSWLVSREASAVAGLLVAGMVGTAFALLMVDMKVEKLQVKERGKQSPQSSKLSKSWLNQLRGWCSKPVPVVEQVIDEPAVTPLPLPKKRKHRHPKQPRIVQLRIVQFLIGDDSDVSEAAEDEFSLDDSAWLKPFCSHVIADSADECDELPEARMDYTSAATSESGK